MSEAPSFIYDTAIKEIPKTKRLSSRDNSTPSRISEPEEDHPAWRSISNEMQYCTYQKQ